MKIFLIGPGIMPIIENGGWGAVENIVWNYYEILTKKGYNVEIINNPNNTEIINYCNSNTPDIVYIMYDNHVSLTPYLTCSKIFYTSHYGYITSPFFRERSLDYFVNILKNVVRNQDKITLISLSEEIKKIYKINGYKNKIYVLQNGAREDKFYYTEHPSLNHKSIYIAKIEKRKKQYKYQNIENIDFVGNYHDTNFNLKNSNYLGEWDKKTLYNNLTEYGNLVLLSSGEACPLVIKEALIAGLGIVISHPCIANLDLSKEFITVIPENKLDDINYVSQKIKENRDYSVENREQIRNYALENFSYEVIINKFLDIIKTI
jgi:glycosyltransferase involved in cell wall biosynthesis